MVCWDRSCVQEEEQEQWGEQAEVGGGAEGECRQVMAAMEVVEAGAGGGRRVRWR